MSLRLSLKLCVNPVKIIGDFSIYARLFWSATSVSPRRHTNNSVTLMGNVTHQRSTTVPLTGVDSINPSTNLMSGNASNLPHAFCKGMHWNGCMLHKIWRRIWIMFVYCTETSNNTKSVRRNCKLFTGWKTDWLYVCRKLER